MEKVLQRMKTVFRRKPGPQYLPPGSYPNPSGNASTLGTITKPPYATDDEDEDEEVESLKNYNVSEQTRLRGQPKDPLEPNNAGPRQNSYSSGSFPPPLPSNAQFRNTSTGFIPGSSTNNNPYTSPNANTGTVPNPSSRPGVPFTSQSPGSSDRSEQNSTPTPSPNTQPFSAGFPRGMNSNQLAPLPSLPTPLPNNSGSTFGGFPPGMNANPTQPPATNSQPLPNQNIPGMNMNQTSSASTAPNPPSSSTGFQPGPNVQTSFSQSNPSQGMFSSFHHQSNAGDDNQSRLELDYPIENVLIDANIPSAMAIKINDVVEQDRFGNKHRIHRYTFEPSESQHLSFANHSQNNRHSGDNSFHGGMRHIREIHDRDYNPPSDDLSYPHSSKKHSRRRNYHYDYSQTSLDQYIDQLLHAPGSTVIQAQNDNDLQRILNQQLYPQVLPTQPSTNVFQSNFDSLPGPVFYYTARALQNDPMRNY